LCYNQLESTQKVVEVVIVEFKMWSTFHYFMMIFPFVLAVVLYSLVKDKPEKTKRTVGIILSILMIGILITRNVYIWTREGTLNPEVIPFQVCHFANFMFLVAVLSRNKVWGTIAWCLNFPAGLVSVIFADGLESNYSTMIDIQAIAYIAGHMLIVTAGIYMLLTGIIQINWKSMKKMYALVACGYIGSVLINSWFNKVFAHTGMDANYFYTYKPEAGTPLEAMFDLGQSYTVLGVTFNPIYLLLLALVGAILLLIMYGIYKIRASTQPRYIRYTT